MTEPRVNNKPTTEGRIYAKDKDIIVPPDCVMTIVEPIESIKQMFIDKTDTKIDEESND